MKTIQQLVDGGYKEAAFKYKANAIKFLNAWQKKGYYVSWLKSSGPTVDAEGHCPSAYYCIAEKTAPKPLTKKQQKFSDEWDRIYELSKNNPKKYWQTIVKPRLAKRGTVDPEIRALVFELNENGLYTIESCAGHGKERGILFFRKKGFDGYKAREIMKKHGITGIARDEEDYISSEGEHNLIYTFNPVGKPKRR